MGSEQPQQRYPLKKFRFPPWFVTLSLSLFSGPSSYAWSAAQLSALPEALSYSPMKLPGPSGHTLARRDLFDARFQLLAQDERDRDERTAAFVDAPADLVPGAYEGGLKTWECALDLAAYLDRDVLGSHSESAATATGRRIRGLRVLEVSLPVVRPWHLICSG